jgi:hypothetical protein
MSFQIFIAAAAAAATTRAAAAARPRAGCAAVRAAQRRFHEAAEDVRARRHPAAAATLRAALLDESGEPAVSDAVAVEGGAPVNHNYTMSEREDDEDGEASGGAAAAEPVAAAEPGAAAEPAAAAQAAARQKRCRLELCAMHCNKSTAMLRAVRWRAQNTAIRIRIPRAAAGAKQCKHRMRCRIRCN